MKKIINNIRRFFIKKIFPELFELEEELKNSFESFNRDLHEPIKRLDEDILKLRKLFIEDIKSVELRLKDNFSQQEEEIKNFHHFSKNSLEAFQIEMQRLESVLESLKKHYINHTNKYHG